MKLITKVLDLGAGIYDTLVRLSAVGKEKFRKKLIALAELKGNETVLDIVVAQEPWISCWLRV